jgi:protein TonB
MKPEMILQADVLDIIFDHLNKEYGAYELRSHYERRLIKSFVAVLFFLCICTACYYWLIDKYHSKITKAISYLSDTVKLATIELEREISTPETVRNQLATVQSATPLIVPDHTPANPPPVIDNPDLIETGTTNNPGDLVGRMVQLPSDGNGDAGDAAEKTVSDETAIFEHPDFMPEFPGGQEALLRFLSGNLRMPGQDLEPGSRISTLVRFVVDKDGVVQCVEFEKSGGKDFDREILRVMKKMPAWKPGMQHGKNVAVYFKIPVIFQAPDEN